MTGIPRRAFIAAALGVAASARPAMAQAPWPAQPGRVVVPYPAGGATDVMGRLVADVLSQATGQRFIVENKGGASGSIGSGDVERAAPDGYTFLIGTPATHVTNAFLRAKMTYDPANFEPVALLSRNPMVLLVRKELPVMSVADLIALAKREPGKLNYASSGAGATSHLAPELFKSMASVDILHVPYRGAGPAMTDLVGGRADVMFDNTQTALPQVEAGAVRAIGVTSANAYDRLPGVPPVGATVPGYEAVSFLALFAPKNTPRTIIDRANGLIAEYFARPHYEKTLGALGVTFTAGPPEMLNEFLALERRKWGALIRERGLTADQ